MMEGLCFYSSKYRVTFRVLNFMRDPKLAHILVLNNKVTVRLLDLGTGVGL